MPLISGKCDFCDKTKNKHMAILTAIGLGASLAGMLAGGIGSAAANRKAQKQLDKQLEENENLFKKDYYQDILARSDVQNLLRTYRENLADVVKAQRNKAVVTGATPEAEAATKKVNARALADTVGNIAAMGQQIKDNAKSNYLNQKNYLLGQKANQYAQNAANWTQVISNSGNILGSLFKTPSV